PYVTVDYMEDIPVQAVQAPSRPLASTGKLQPYAAHRSQLRAQKRPSLNPRLVCSFGYQNAPAPAQYDWLVHLDRPVISPIELLHVSGYQPYQLTQRFMSVDTSGNVLRFAHRAPWLDEDLPASGPSS